MKKRNNTIDIQRAIIFLVVISAHCGFPEVYDYWRTFELPMIIFLSGFSASLSTNNSNESYFSYVLKRFKKLIVPVWIFITFYLLFFTLVYGQNFSMVTIITSYSMTSGIGFVWIFRIVFIVALLNPLFIKIVEKFNFKQSIFIAIGLLVANEVVYYLILMGVEGEKMRSILYIIFTYNLGYGILSYFGILWNRISSREKMLLAFSSTLIFLGLGWGLSFPSTQDFKYPPQTYYILYGIVIAMISYIIIDRFKFQDSSVMNILRWVSKNSLTIYLWHVFVLGFMDNSLLSLVISNYLLRFIFVTSTSIILTFIQQNVITKFYDLTKSK